jgi:short-subunit dehydrogenase
VWVALPYLKKQGGSLIIVTSITSRVSVPFNSASSASKHAVEGFMESLRVELKHENAKVNLVHILPGPVSYLYCQSSVKNSVFYIYDRHRDRIHNGSVGNCIEYDLDVYHEAYLVILLQHYQRHENHSAES